VHLPPLREHLEDTPLLAKHLVKRFSKNNEIELSDGVLEYLQTYHWPGNVREFSHTLEQAYILNRGKISVEHLDLSKAAAPSRVESGSFKSTIEQTERELLQRSFEMYRGNKTKAARHLGMKPSTFRDKLRKYNLD